MAVIESLVKKHGGWSKIRIKGAEYSGLNKVTMDACAFDIAADLEKIEDSLVELNAAIDEAYEQCLDVKSSMGEKTFLSPEKLPECVVVATIQNSIHRCKYIPTKITYKNFLDNVDRTIKRLENNPVHALVDMISAESLNSTSFFNWSYSPEGGRFWQEIYNKAQYNDCEGLDNFAIYHDFLQKHPECKEEIKEFCKK